MTRDYTDETKTPKLAVGDFVTSLSSGKPRRVTRIEGGKAWYQDPEYGEIWGDYDSVAERKVESPAEQHFATGSRVRFRNDVTYTVTDFDGELHELVPDDDSETLHFSPDFFELVSPPPVPSGTAARHNDTGTNALVRWASADEVSLMAVGDTFVVSRIEFEADYTIL